MLSAPIFIQLAEPLKFCTSVVFCVIVAGHTKVELLMFVCSVTCTLKFEPETFWYVIFALLLSNVPSAKSGVMFTVILTLKAVLVILPISQVLLLVFSGELLI